MLHRRCCWSTEKGKSYASGLACSILPAKKKSFRSSIERQETASEEPNMKAARNFAITVLLLTTLFTLPRLKNVSAQIGGGVSCCSGPYNTCALTAESGKTSCIQTCATKYTYGSPAYNTCVSSCTGIYNTALAQCTLSYNNCILQNTDWCEDVQCPAQCSDGSTVTYCHYIDNCTVPSCAVSCSCPMPPPDCPTPQCDGTEWVCNSPIIIDWKGEGFHLTSAQDGVYFNFTGNGNISKYAWT